MDYILRFEFSTAKPLKSGAIKGSTARGECVITSDLSLEELKSSPNDLVPVAYESLISNPKVKKMGSVLSINIIDVVNSDTKYLNIKGLWKKN